MFLIESGHKTGYFRYDHKPTKDSYQVFLLSCDCFSKIQSMNLITSSIKTYKSYSHGKYIKFKQYRH